MSQVLPRRIGNVRLLERLGEGGMAVVHRGEDLFRPDRQLAVKLLKGEQAGDAEVVRRFLREGQVLKELSHPNLVEVFDFGRTGSTPFLVMELLPGGSVKGCLGEPPATLVSRLVPVADALAFAHAHGVIHRDLKPSNLLFGQEGHLKVTDFGVCLFEGEEGDRLTRSRMVVGTLGYMAPEQHGDPRLVDGRCDVYALAAVLFEFTTGQPWAQTQLPPAVARPGFPPRLGGILMRALSADPTRRTPDMHTFQGELTDWLGSAEAAGWGTEPLPGYAEEIREAATQARAKGEPEPSELRLGPYLDALQTGGVGVRRSAADGLATAARPEDEAFLLQALLTQPEASRHALANALGRMGSAQALPALRALLEDPYAHREACDALSRIAQRAGLAGEVSPWLTEAGLGQPWRWAARARLGDPSWAEALAASWPSLAAPQRLQALEAAMELPPWLRESLKPRLQGGLKASEPAVRKAWEGL